MWRWGLRGSVCVCVCVCVCVLVCNFVINCTVFFYPVHNSFFVHNCVFTHVHNRLLCGSVSISLSHTHTPLSHTHTHLCLTYTHTHTNSFSLLPHTPFGIPTDVDIISSLSGVGSVEYTLYPPPPHSRLMGNTRCPGHL